MNEEFENLPWHDANLQRICINRQNPGENDSVSFLIEWPEESSLSSVEFYDCYAFNAQMNFGIVSSESILKAECINDSPEIKAICDKWLKIGVELANLKCYRIITNSTHSIIDVFSLGFSINKT